MEKDCTDIDDRTITAERTESLTADVRLIVQLIRELQDRVCCDACRAKIAEVFANRTPLGADMLDFYSACNVVDRESKPKACPSCQQYNRLIREAFRECRIEFDYMACCFGNNDIKDYEEAMLNDVDGETLKQACARLLRFVGRMCAPLAPTATSHDAT